MDPATFDPRFLKGVEFFNDCEFYESHDEWEELWTDYQGPSRAFYQGLIQVAVCLHHFGNGNTSGARKLYHSSRKYLENYPPFYHGVDLEALLAEMTACCQKVLDSEERFPEVEIDPDLIPDINLRDEDDDPAFMT